MKKAVKKAVKKVKKKVKKKSVKAKVKVSKGKLPKIPKDCVYVDKYGVDFIVMLKIGKVFFRSNFKKLKANAVRLAKKTAAKLAVEYFEV